MESRQRVVARGNTTNPELPLFVGDCKERVSEHTDISIIPWMQVAFETHRHFCFGEVETCALVKKWSDVELAIHFRHSVKAADRAVRAFELQLLPCLKPEDVRFKQAANVI